MKSRIYIYVCVYAYLPCWFEMMFIDGMVYNFIVYDIDQCYCCHCVKGVGTTCGSI